MASASRDLQWQTAGWQVKLWWNWSPGELVKFKHLKREEKKMHISLHTKVCNFLKIQEILKWHSWMGHSLDCQVTPFSWNVNDVSCLFIKLWKKLSPIKKQWYARKHSLPAHHLTIHFQILHQPLSSYSQWRLLHAIQGKISKVPTSNTPQIRNKIINALY